MFLNLVRQRTKNICSASNDQGENLQNPAKKNAKIPQQPAKKTQKPANPEITFVLVIFRILLEFQKFYTVCVHGRSAEIFPETYMFGTKWIIFLVIWPIFLELAFFSSAVEGRGICIIMYTRIHICLFVRNIEWCIVDQSMPMDPSPSRRLAGSEAEYGIPQLHPAVWSSSMAACHPTGVSPYPILGNRPRILRVDCRCQKQFIVL